MPLSSDIRTLARFAYHEFHVGDYIWYGKYKNKRGKIKGFKKDEKGFDVAIIEPVPKGRKQDKELSVYKFRPMNKTETEESKAKTAQGHAYKNKKEVPKQDGNGTTTVYEYSENHVKKRTKNKVDKVNKLQGSIDKVLAKARKDLKSDDPRKRLPALAVLLMDATYERVGNIDSAKEGHFGVTTWEKRHLTFKGNTAHLNYVGKSGVDQKKKITDGKLVSELRTQAFQKTKHETLLTDDEAEYSVSAADVNAYLKPFEITAKDIRGYHANRIVQEMLKDLTPVKGDDPKEVEKARKDQFKSVLEDAAAEVGHEPSTLKNQYLAPSLEKDFIDDGKVNKSVRAMERTAQSNIETLIKSIVDWRKLLELHVETLNALERLAEDKRKLRADGLKTKQIDYTDDRISGEVVGSKGDVYHPHVTIRPRRGHYCTCPDWARNGRRVGPCKHILKLVKDAKDGILADAISSLDGRVSDVEDLLVDIVEHASFE